MENEYIGVYGSLVEDLLNVGKFKRSKHIASLMSTDEKYDIYKGVYRMYIRCITSCRQPKVKHLFQSIDDWYRIHLAVKFVESYRNNNKFFSGYTIKWR